MNLTLEYDSFQDFASKLWPCLSEEGMWISSEEPADVGELVDFDVMLADGFRLFHGTGQVIDVGPGPAGAAGGSGMTLRFSQLDQPSRNLVRKVVSKHIGEGGKLFVLSTPGTKVEVVGDEAGTEGGPDGGMGPEDLVAPFAGLEEDQAWGGDQEPELTSFLRPSGRGADLDKVESPAATEEFDFAASERADETPPVEPTVAGSPIFEAPSVEADLGFDFGQDSAEEEAAEPAVFEAPIGTPDLPEAPDLPDVPEVPDVPQLPDVPELVPELPDAPELDAPAVEPWDAPEVEAPDLGVNLGADLGETQRVDPVSGLGEAQTEMPLGEFDSLQPLPSTVIPPSFGDAGTDNQDDEPNTDDFYPQGMSASSGRTWWPWVVVGGLAVGAGLYGVLRMDTPLSGLFGGGAESEQATSAGAGGRAEGDGGQAADATDGGESGVESEVAEMSAEAGAGAADGEDEPATTEAGSADAPAAAGDAALQSGQSGAVADSRAATKAARVEAPSSDSTAPETPAPAADEPTPVEEGAAGSALVPIKLQRITWRDVDGDTVVRLAMSGPLAGDRFATQRVAGGSPRLVLKVNGAEGSVPRVSVPIGSDHVQQLRFGVHNVDGMRQVHAVADLADEGVEMVGSVAVVDGAVELRFSRP